MKIKHDFDIIIADASPLIILARLEQMQLLTSIFNYIIVPPQVADECIQNPSKPGARIIQEAISNHVINIYNENFTVELETSILGEGEAAAISLANHLNLPILIDDNYGRRIAQQKGIEVIGTLGILIRAKQLGLIQELSILFKEMQNLGFRISKDLVKKALSSVQE